MLPGTRGEAETTRQIVLYSLALVAFTLVVGIWLGPLYTVAAALLGGVPRASSPGGSAPTRAGATPSSCSTTRWRTSRCCSSRPRSTRCVALMLSPELQRKNMRLGLALFAVFVALFVGACLIALLYLQVD